MSKNTEDRLCTPGPGGDAELCRHKRGEDGRRFIGGQGALNLEEVLLSFVQLADRTLSIAKGVFISYSPLKLLRNFPAKP